MDKNGTKATLNQTSLNTQTAPAAFQSPALRELFTLGASVQGTDGPDDLPIRAIHRGPSGYIPLVVKKDGIDWQELGAIQIGQPFLPTILAALANDGYFALNTSYGTRPRVNKVSRETWQPIEGERGGEQLVTTEKTRLSWTNHRTKLAWANHTTDTLRWLNVAYADIDCYKHELTIGDALGAIVDMQDAGQIPAASMFLRSGRGLWALWFLIDHQNPASGEKVIYRQTHHPDTPARAWPRTVALYARVQNAIVRKLAHLGADLAAADAARYCPVPGTRKTGATERVLYWAQSIGNSGPPLYTLTQLATGLQLELQAREHPVIEAALKEYPREEGVIVGYSRSGSVTTKNPRRQKAAIKGWKVRWNNAVRDLEILKRLRQGLWTTSRNVFAFYYAAALKRAGMSTADVEERVLTFAMHVGLKKHEAKSAIKQGKEKTKFSHIRRDVMLEQLEVTPAERFHLDIGRKREPAPTAGKASIQGRRDAILEAIVANRGKVPSVRDMADILTRQGVPCGNHSTVHRDYQALGLKPLSKAGRPPKLPL